jgi:hypothetical protein
MRDHIARRPIAAIDGLIVAHSATMLPISQHRRKFGPVPVIVDRYRVINEVAIHDPCFLTVGALVTHRCCI